MEALLVTVYFIASLLVRRSRGLTESPQLYGPSLPVLIFIYFLANPITSSPGAWLYAVTFSGFLS